MKYDGEYGLIVLDKPKGIKCIEIDRMLERKFGRKVGHCGTLDPMVSGVLPVLVGKWTRLESVFQKKDKVYIGVMRTHRDVSVSDFQNVARKFTGEITQVPPRVSAVSRKPRKRMVYSIKLLEHHGRDWLIEFHVQAGTYIRKLIHDMGIEIGGAHMADLRRIRSGGIGEDISVNLQDVMSDDFDFLNPVDFLGLPRWAIRNANRVRKGTPIFADTVLDFEQPEIGQSISLFDESGNFIGIGRYTGGEKIVAVPDIII